MLFHATDPTGAVFSAKFKNGISYGVGNLKYPNGDTYVIFYEYREEKNVDLVILTPLFFLFLSYEGTFKPNTLQKHGKGTYCHATTGDVYDGEYRDNYCHGTGKFLWVDGTKYEGGFKNGIEFGYGVYETPEGDKYSGQFKDGQPHGEGHFSYKDGNDYTGTWREGKREGEGTFRYANGDVYVGAFENNKKHGAGKMSYSEGDVFEGEYEAGEESSGLFQHSNGDQYRGAYVNSLSHGHGEARFANGDVYIGDFCEGSMQGFGRYTTASDQTTFEGNFYDNERTGAGMLLHQNGNIDILHYKSGNISESGVRWGRFRKVAYHLKAGQKGSAISIEEAAKITKNFGLSLPPPDSTSAEKKFDASEGGSLTTQSSPKAPVPLSRAGGRGSEGERVAVRVIKRGGRGLGRGDRQSSKIVDAKEGPQKETASGTKKMVVPRRSRLVERKKKAPARATTKAPNKSEPSMKVRNSTTQQVGTDM